MNEQKDTLATFRDPHELRHPFIQDAIGSRDCAACGQGPLHRAHAEPFEMTRDDAEAICIDWDEVRNG